MRSSIVVDMFVHHCPGFQLPTPSAKQKWIGLSSLHDSSPRMTPCLAKACGPR